MNTDEVLFSDDGDEEPALLSTADFSSAVVFSSDWTTETIVSQVQRSNIVLNPKFQRRDAWDLKRKSRFLESLLVGLPVPQVVLAESRDKRGSYVVLDGKQRLLSLLQYWGFAAGPRNAFALTGLDIRPNLNGLTYAELAAKPEHQDDFRQLLNQTIRTVVIRNWPSYDFLHLVFLRLNTGSVKLSPQELRQAMLPGLFSDYVEEWSANCSPLANLLKLREPDYRMRDLELVVRFLAFRFLSSRYHGRLKEFLDELYETMNREWPSRQGEVLEALRDFETGVACLIEVFGRDDVARKHGSRVFNRAVFDPLIYFASDPQIQSSMRQFAKQVAAAYAELVQSPLFRMSVERDTAGVPSTSARFQQWASALESAIGEKVTAPALGSE